MQGLYTNDLQGLDRGLESGLHTGVHHGLYGDKNVCLSLTENVLAYWKLNNTITATNYQARDEKGIQAASGNYGHNVVASVGIGRIQNGFKFNGSSNYIDIDPAPIGITNTALHVGATDYSISCWIYMIARTSPFSAIYNKGNNVAARTYCMLFVNTSGKLLHALAYDLETKQDQLTSNTVIPLNTWTHIVCIRYTTRVMNTWINGVKDTASTLNIGVAPTINYNTPGAIGAYQNHTLWYFNGNISELGIWGKALSEQEIKYLYNNGKGITYPFIKALK